MELYRKNYTTGLRFMPGSWTSGRSDERPEHGLREDVRRSDGIRGVLLLLSATWQANEKLIATTGVPKSLTILIKLAQTISGVIITFGGIKPEYHYDETQSGILRAKEQGTVGLDAAAGQRADVRASIERIPGQFSSALDAYEGRTRICHGELLRLRGRYGIGREGKTSRGFTRRTGAVRPAFVVKKNTTIDAH